MYKSTLQKFSELPPEYQKEAEETLKALQKYPSCRPDEWEHIVDYFYDEYKSTPVGWFQYWDD